MRLALSFIPLCVFRVLFCFLSPLGWFFLWLPEEVLTLLFLLYRENGDFSILMNDNYVQGFTEFVGVFFVFFRYWLSFCTFLVSEIINSVWLILNNGTCINEHEGGLTGGSCLFVCRLELFCRCKGETLSGLPKEHNW